MRDEESEKHRNKERELVAATLATVHKISDKALEVIQAAIEDTSLPIGDRAFLALKFFGSDNFWKKLGMRELQQAREALEKGDE